MKKSLFNTLELYIKEKEIVINKIIIILLFLQFTVFRWLHISIYAGYLFDLLVIVSYIFLPEKYNKRLVCFVFLLGLYFLINYIINGGTIRNIVANYRDLFSPMLLILYTCYLVENRIIDNRLEKIVFPANFYMLLNIVAIHFEANGYTWLAGKTFVGFTGFTVFQDSISGLLGLYGVPLLGMFMIFLLLSNHLYANYKLTGKKRIIFNTYNIVLLVYSLVISYFNDNKIFYVLLFFIIPLFIIEILIYNDSSRDKTKAIKHLLYYFVIMIILLIILHFVFDEFREMEYKVFQSLKDALDYENAFNIGSGERLSILLYFVNKIGLFFGMGLGKGRWTQKGLLGFKHFGINDLGAILCLGGLVLLLLILAMYYELFKKMYKSNIKRIVFLVLTIIVMFLTQINMNFSGMILYLMICLVFYWFEIEHK